MNLREQRRVYGRDGMEERKGGNDIILISKNKKRFEERIQIYKSRHPPQKKRTKKLIEA